MISNEFKELVELSNKLYYKDIKDRIIQLRKRKLEEQSSIKKPLLKRKINKTYLSITKKGTKHVIQRRKEIS